MLGTLCKICLTDVHQFLKNSNKTIKYEKSWLYGTMVYPFYTVKVNTPIFYDLDFFRLIFCAEDILYVG